ncbi:uncharacterized protein LOC106652888 [Trichogramma pretiosum]|uniref:uncharacterized protein LOC106652888 n=1 Tax=Trichogramma pretiosum TaxID=7493 RepID=UPI0006C9DA7B|nr:uncharacterized protein LOC106652888 [Trichogramma pretiosum]
MAGNTKKALKSLSSQLFKGNFPYSVGGATENVSKQISIIQNSARTKLGHLMKQLNGSSITQNPDIVDLQSSRPLPRNLMNYWNWYQQLTGMDKIEAAKNHVIFIQNKLFECQDQRRHIAQQVASVTEKLKDIYSELIQTKRNDSKYVQLTILENKKLQEHLKLAEQLELIEGEEKDYFTRLATAIKEYHDCQAINTQQFKYLSILASASLAIFSLIGSIIYNNIRISSMKNLISEAQNSIESNLNDQLLLISKKIDVQEENITAALTSLQINNVSESQISNVPHQDYEVASTHTPYLDMEQIKVTSYYLGVTVCLIYLIRSFS